MSTTTTNPNEQQYYNRFDNDNNNNNDDTTMINKSNIGSRSGWLYPIKGIMYLLLSFQSSPKSTNNINIYRSIVINQICWIILPTLGLIMILFNHTFKHQLAIISSLGQNASTQWFDIVFASVSILIQATIIVLRLMQFIVKKNATRIFVQVLKQQNYWNYDTMIEPDYSPCSNCCSCSYTTGNCRGISSWIICILVLFPLLIFVNPIVATITYALFNAPFAAWDYLDYYFNINPLMYDNNIQRSMLLYGNNKNKNDDANNKLNQTTTTNTITDDDNNNIDDDSSHDDSQLQRCCCCCYIPSNKSILYRYNYCTNPYSQFGFICSLMEIIPLLGPSIFVLTNAVGTALFVIQMLPNPNNINDNSNNDNNKQQEMV